MNYLWLSIEIIFTILIATGCGAFLARKNILHEQALKDLSNILVYVILPCLLFSKIISAISFEALRELWVFPVAALVNIGSGLCIGLIVSLFCRKQKEFKRGIIASIGFNNGAYIPLVIVVAIVFQAQELFTEQNASANGITFISLYLVPYMFLVWLVGYPIIAREKLKNLKLSKVITPPLIATLAAIVLGLIPWAKSLFVGNGAPLAMFQQAASILGSATMPLALIFLGGNLAFSYGKTKIKFSTVFYVAFGKYILAPIIAVLFLLLIKSFGWKGTPMMSFVILMEGFMPPTMNLVVMCQFAETNRKNMAALMFWMYIIAIPAMTIWLTITMKLI